MTSEPQLREHYPPAIDRALLKVLRKLDRHCERFIALSPFLCIGTAGERGIDVSPRGDRPGFVKILDEVTLAIPDWPGNNRIDSLTNLVSNPQIGILFLIPGVDESLRVNGTARITNDPGMVSRWETNGKNPRSVMIVTVQEAFLHCAKALIRSRLWHDDFRVDRSVLPSYACMLKDQIDIDQTAEEIDRSVMDGYRNKLY
jgi:PPOX class probable FMN-dependent enzyme